MLEYIAHLKELLDYFSFMNDKISTGLISCILPLTKFSRDLKVFNLNSILGLCGCKRLCLIVLEFIFTGLYNTGCEKGDVQERGHGPNCCYKCYS
jgi:hypothetical protein